MVKEEKAEEEIKEMMSSGRTCKNDCYRADITL